MGVFVRTELLLALKLIESPASSWLTFKALQIWCLSDSIRLFSVSRFSVVGESLLMFSATLNGLADYTLFVIVRLLFFLTL